ncbi:MAG: phosphodiester glycosidase family protein [Eubacteriales bacterium]|nr:phosphodiester glycosidase family protein [Eubacteriales bacterium]
MRGKYEARPQKRRPEPVRQTRKTEQPNPARGTARPTPTAQPNQPHRTAAPQAQRTAPSQPRRTVPQQPRRPIYRKPTLGEYLARALAVVLTAIVVLACTLLISMKMICGSTSPSAKRTFVTTMLETGQLKFLVSWFVPSAEVQEIVNANSMAKIDDDVDANLITFENLEEDQQNAEVKDLEVIDISGRTYSGKLIKVRDPSRISLATIYPWRDTGVTLEELAQQSGALAAINGGIYDSTNNTGGRPYGVIVSNGEIQHNQPNEWPGLVLVGFDNDNILQIIDVNGMTPGQLEDLVEEKGIRDAVTFQEESSDANNHFVQLIINGTARGMNGVGSGLNPRTAIGQCADGSVLLLVTDGRGKNGHLGASAADLIEIMTQYGAVNAANLDGGSSTCMYYNGEYLMTSVTFYYSNSSWKLPAGFIVK